MGAVLISGAARLAGVLGWPVTHSISPALHNFWMARYGVDGAYVPLAVRPEDLELSLSGLRRAGFLGFNVTIPHKTAIAKLVDELDDDARSMGSVNTVLIGPDGSAKGYSTDGQGFLQNLYEQAVGWSAVGKRVLLLGAGGAARAIAFALINAGIADLRICNRSTGRAESLVDTCLSQLGSTSIVDWQDRSAAVSGADLVVNTTSLGMVGQPELGMDLSETTSGTVIADIVYAPLETELLRQAREHGLKSVDGLGMLIHQAIPGFAHWGGVRPTVDEELREFAKLAVRR